jgi:hypothetical protein
LYKDLLRSASTFPSKNRAGIYREIRREWRVHAIQPDPEVVRKQVAVAYKGLQQLRQYDESAMTGGRGAGSANWTVTLEQNPMPKPPGYDDDKKKKTKKQN